MSQMLEERLRTLDIRTPSEVVSRALTAATRPPKHQPVHGRRRRRSNRYAKRLAYAAAAVVAVLIANIAVAYFVPANGQAFANAPVIGQYFHGEHTGVPHGEHTGVPHDHSKIHGAP
jgi:hypothetical protein